MKKVVSFVKHILGPEHRRHAAAYITGQMSRLERKTGEGIAYLLDQQRQGIKKFIGEVPWDHQPMLRTLAG
jgi:SRSO17 transposase